MRPITVGQSWCVNQKLYKNLTILPMRTTVSSKQLLFTKSRNLTSKTRDTGCYTNKPDKHFCSTRRYQRFKYLLHKHITCIYFQLIYMLTLSFGLVTIIPSFRFVILNFFSWNLCLPTACNFVGNI